MTSLLNIITNRDEYAAVSPAMPSGWLPIRRRRDGQLFVGQRLKLVNAPQPQPPQQQQQQPNRPPVNFHALLTTGYLDKAAGAADAGGDSAAAAGAATGDGAAVADATQEKGEVFYKTLQRLLRHDNLVSIEAVTAVSVPLLPGRDVEVPMIVWDLCDAGTLAALLADLPDMARTGMYGGRTGSLHQGMTFVPESLCWHVVRSVLQALAWLHDGYATLEATLDEAGEVVLPQPQADWMPIVHRAVSPEHIFFQHPLGSETYGCCKLGCYSECLVSGQVDGPHARTSLAAAPPTHLIQGNVNVLGRDYFCTRGLDLGGLGEVLHHMMEGQPWMTAAEKNDAQMRVARRKVLLGQLDAEDAADVVHDNDNDTDGTVDGEVGYTHALRKLRRDLLRYTDGQDFTGGKEVVLEVFDQAERGYLWWRRNTADGWQYVDVSDVWETEE